MSGELERIAARMRRDWDARAAANAEHYVYTRDSASDEADFDASGKANYDQLVRPYLPVLLDARPPGLCRALEIGCGIGRMTRWFAAAFGHVDAVDVSPAMLERARERLRGCGNVGLHQGSGYDLAGLPDSAYDLVFSYIVFQHIPSRAAIDRYVAEAARVLRPGGAFKFQLNGDQSPAYRAHERDTWLGETFTEAEARAMLDRAGFSVLMAEGAGTQYFVLTARKGIEEPAPGPRPYIFPGEPWAAAQLGEGWGDAVDASWRGVGPRSTALVAVPGPGPARFFMGLYFWPDDPHREHRIEITIGGAHAGAATLAGAGDQYLELSVDAGGFAAEVGLAITPPCEPRYAPAVRCLGFYLRATSTREG